MNKAECQRNVLVHSGLIMVLHDQMIKKYLTANKIISDMLHYESIVRNKLIIHFIYFNVSFILLGVEQKKKTEEDRVGAIDIRKKAMERLGETKRRKETEEEVEEKKRKRRRSGSETLAFLKEHTSHEMMVREKELEMEKEKQVKEEQRHKDWKDIVAQQMAQQQQQMGQFQMMMVQQNNLLLSMIEKMSSHLAANYSLPL